MSKPVVFVHIPKTAGTTMRTVLRRLYPDGHRVHIRAFTQDALETKSGRAIGTRALERTCIFGHMVFGVHRYADQAVDYLSMVRDPVNRVLSDYYYVLQTPWHECYDPVVTQHYTLRDYVTSGVTTYTDNIQVRMLSGEGKAVPYGACTAAMLERAKTNIDDRFAVVGVTERFDESLILMQRALGWRTPWYVRKNKTKRRPPREAVSDEVRDLIREQNALDVELYQFASRRFEKMVAEQDDTFQQDMRRLIFKNRVLDPPARLYLWARAMVAKLGRDR